MTRAARSWPRRAAVLFVGLTAGVVAFQLALAAGVPWGALTMGGAFPGRLPPRMRVVAVGSALLLAALAAIVAAWGAAAALAAGCAAEPAAERADPYAGAPVVEGDTALRFPSGARVASGLRARLRYHGRLPDAEGGPWLVVSGVECDECDAGPSVLVRSARAAPGAAWEGPGWHAAPGRVLSFDTDLPLLESRLFWGRCLPGRPAGVVQFATEFDSTGRATRALVLLSEVRGGRLHEDSLVQAPPAASAVEPAVRAGRCHEVAPEGQIGGF